MMNKTDPVALAVFVFFFVLVTIMGFVAARWRRPKTLASIDEWGLGGRQFGTWITWFLIGGDFYTRPWSTASEPTVSSRCRTRSSSTRSSLP